MIIDFKTRASGESLYHPTRLYLNCKRHTKLASCSVPIEALEILISVTHDQHEALRHHPASRHNIDTQNRAREARRILMSTILDC